MSNIEGIRYLMPDRALNKDKTNPYVQGSDMNFEMGWFYFIFVFNIVFMQALCNGRRP